MLRRRPSQNIRQGMAPDLRRVLAGSGRHQQRTGKGRTAQNKALIGFNSPEVLTGRMVDERRHLEPESAAANGLDDLLSRSVVAERFARGIYARGYGRVRNDPPVPDSLDDLIMPDHAPRIGAEEYDDVEHLRFDLHRFSVSPNLDRIEIDQKGFEPDGPCRPVSHLEFHACHCEFPGQHSRNTRAVQQPETFTRLPASMLGLSDSGVIAWKPRIGCLPTRRHATIARGAPGLSYRCGVSSGGLAWEHSRRGDARRENGSCTPRD